MKLGAYRSPKTLSEAVRMLTEKGSMPFGGGSDLIVKAHLHPDWYKDAVYVDLGQVREACGICFQKDSGQISGQGRNIWIGAAETISHIVDSVLVREQLPLLHKAASAMASLQVRNKATLGGNLANGCPASDLIPSLAVLNAQALTVSEKSAEQKIPVYRLIPVRELYKTAAACRKHEDMQPSGCFYKDPLHQRTVLKAGEWILGVVIPVSQGSVRWFRFQKLSANRSIALGIMNLAMLGEAMTAERKAEPEDETMPAEGLKSEADRPHGPIRATWCLGGLLPFPRVVTMEFDPDQEDLLRLAEEEANRLLLFGKENCPDSWDYKRRAAKGLIYQGLCQLTGQRD